MERRGGHTSVRADQELNTLADQRRHGARAAADENRLYFKTVFLPDFSIRRHPRWRRARRHGRVGDAKFFGGVERTGHRDQ